MELRERVADRLSGGSISELRETVHQQEGNLFLLRESMQRLEQALHAPGWERLTIESRQEFTREGLNRIAALARIMYLKNPIIKRGVDIQRLYVWAQGVTIRAADPDINAVIQEFLDDERNRVTLTGHQSRQEREVDLQLTGNLFFRFFPDAQGGRVRVRDIDFHEVLEIICNPEDKDEPWFYKRVYSVKSLDGSVTTKTAYYPDWQYIPRVKPAPSFANKIDWATPVMHVRVNPVGRFGVSEEYAALDWALAYKSFLENLAAVWQAMAQFAWKLNTKGGAAAVAAARSKLGTTVGSSSGETNPPPLAGSTWIQAGDAFDMQPMKTAGATMSADDGRRLFLMAAAVSGFPETFYGDASVGSLATAKSLDRPTELKIADRQELWVEILKNILNFVLMRAIASGKLRGKGRVVRLPDGGQWLVRIEWNEGIDSGLTVDFPPIIDIDVKEYVDALVSATTLNGSPPVTITKEDFLRQALVVLGFDDVDGIMKRMTDEGEFEEEQEEERAAVFVATERLLEGIREAVGKNGHVGVKE